MVSGGRIHLVEKHEIASHYLILELSSDDHQVRFESNTYILTQPHSDEFLLPERPTCGGNYYGSLNIGSRND